MHAAIYRTRKDARAIVHTHPPTATAFGVIKLGILPLQIEMFMSFPDGVPVVPFETPGSKALAKKISERITKCDAVILGNHGIVTVGSTIQTACDLNEMIEEAAKIQLLVMSLTRGNMTRMDLATLKKKFEAMANGKSRIEDV